jgi:hypothetical protein
MTVMGPPCEFLLQRLVMLEPTLIIELAGALEAVSRRMIVSITSNDRNCIDSGRSPLGPASGLRATQ